MKTHLKCPSFSSIAESQNIILYFKVALPTGYLFNFSYVYDDVNGGLKPFCSTEELVNQV
jgi:hypothetical protein